LPINAYINISHIQNILKKSKIEILHLGIKKVTELNFTKIILLPKKFTDLLDEDMFVLIELVGDTLMITPTNSEYLSESV